MNTSLKSPLPHPLQVSVLLLGLLMCMGCTKDSAKQVEPVRYVSPLDSEYIPIEEFAVHSERFSKPVEFGAKYFPDEYSWGEYFKNDFDKINWSQIHEELVSMPSPCGGSYYHEAYYVGENSLKQQIKLDSDAIIPVKTQRSVSSIVETTGGAGCSRSLDYTPPPSPPLSRIALNEINCQTSEIKELAGIYASLGTDYVVISPEVKRRGYIEDKNHNWRSCEGAPEGRPSFDAKLCKYVCDYMNKVKAVKSD